MKTIGITGSTGFLGRNLVERCRKGNFSVVEIGRGDFADENLLAQKVASCCDIVHFAGLSRHENGEFLYRVNLELGKKLVRAANCQPGALPRLILASTTHIAKDSCYHKSKRDLAALFAQSGKQNVELLMPNTFGAGGKPFYNSVVSTFCRVCCDHATPSRIDDVEIALIYVETLMDGIVNILRDDQISGRILIPDEYHVRLPEVWEILQKLARGEKAADDFQRDLAATLFSYQKES